jgi:hypothetical protein
MDANDLKPGNNLSRLQELAAKVQAMAPTQAVALGKLLVAGHETSQPSPLSTQVSSEPIAPDPGTGNAAIDRCLAAWAEARQKARASGRSDDADNDGKAAYLRAMPPLVGPENIANFVGCVMRGSIEDIIYPYEINKFLYAAQVANGVRNPTAPSAPKRPRGRPSTAKTDSPDSSEEDNSSVNIPEESLK